MGEQYIGPPVTGTLGSFGTLMNLIKPFIGAGILAMPNAWHEGGLISSNIILLVLAYVAGWCIYRLVEASELIMKRDALYNAKLRIARQLRANDLNDQVTEPSYFEAVESVTEKDLIEEDWATVTMPSFTDVGGAAMGRFGRILVDMSIVITQFGACIAYVIFISSNLTSIVGLNTSLWVAILILPFLFLSLIRQMDMLAPTSTLGNVVYLFVISTIFYIGFKDYCCVPFEDLNLSDPSYFPFVFGTCSFALEGIALVMPVKQRMAEPKNFPWIMFAAMCVVTTVYFSFSSLGYMFFGNETLSPVIDSLPKGALTDVIKICLCVSLFFTFALILFPASTFFDEVIDAKLDIDIARDHAKLIEETMNRNVDEVEDVVAIGQAQDNVNVNNNAENDDPASPVAIAPTVEDMYPHLVTKRNSYQNIVRVVSVLFICAVGVAFPDFKLIVALFGSFSNAMLAYIFPAYFWIKVCASTHLYGVEYFPYTRNGDPLRHPLDVVAAQAGHGDNDGNARGDNARGTNYGTNYGSVQDKESAIAHKHGEGPFKASCCKKFFVLFFPITVTIAGLASSAIGVYGAINDIIAHYQAE